jgi:transaldolase
MKIFIDTANLDEIREVAEWGVVSGVTTNPSLIAKNGGTLVDVITQISKLICGPISAEVSEGTIEEMITQAQQLRKLSPNIVIKVPCTIPGIAAARKLKELEIPTNVTLVFSAAQAVLASEAEATYISPFLGRLDDKYGQGSGIEKLREIVAVLKDSPTKIIAASIRSVEHAIQAALAGADIATIPYKVLKEMYEHPLTTAGLEIFRQAEQTAKK